MQVYHIIPDTEEKTTVYNGTVLSIFFNQTNDGSSEDVLDFLENKSDQIDLSKLVKLDYPFNRNMYSYFGTETSPPCKNQMVWYLTDNVNKISKAQHDWLNNMVDKSTAPNGNYRALQPEISFVMYKHNMWTKSTS